MVSLRFHIPAYVALGGYFTRESSFFLSYVAITTIAILQLDTDICIYMCVYISFSPPAHYQATKASMGRYNSNNKSGIALLVIAVFLSTVTASEQSSTSYHVIKISGTHWGDVTSTNAKGLEAALITDISVQLVRKYSFETTINVSSVHSNSLLKVYVTVKQDLITEIPDARLQHIWPPDEVNSMIAQGSFSNTLALYHGTDTAALVSVLLPDSGRNIGGNAEINFILLAVWIIIGVAMGVSFLVTILFHFRCIGKEKS